MSADDARSDLLAYRDARVRAMSEAGLSKMEIHRLSGLSGRTIDHILT